MADELTPTPTGDPVAPPAQPATPPTQPPASPTVDSKIFAPDGKTWKDKFFGEQGRRQQVENQSATHAGSFEAQLETAQRDGQIKDAEIARLNASIAELTNQTGAIPDLRTQVEALTPQAARAARLEILMGYPSLVAAQVEEEFTPEGGEPQKRMVNPFLNLVNSTGLEGQALVTELGRLSAAIGTPATPPAVVAGAVPPPASPAPGNDAESHRANAMKWHQYVVNGVIRTDDGKDPLEEERKAWAAMEEALTPT